MNILQGAFLIILLFLRTVYCSAWINDASRPSVPTQEKKYNDSMPASVYKGSPGAQSYYLLNPEKPGEPCFSGERQHGNTGGLTNPLRVRVVNQRSEPVVGIPVIFEVVNYPSGGDDYHIDRKMVPTDSSGMAFANFRLGTVRGEYQVIARIRSSGEENIRLFNIFARDRKWPFLMLTGIAGGLVLFLLGMELVGSGLVRMAGDRMKSVPGNWSNNRFKGLWAGTFFTVANSGSNATHLMLMSFVNAGMLKFRQSFGIILGAGIGTAIFAQVIAFRVADFSLLFLAAGFAMRAFNGSGHIRNAGDLLLGLGILFFGIYFMSESLYPLRSFEPFLHLLAKLEKPVTGIVTGTVLAALTGGSAAFAGILIIFGMQGMMSLEASIPLIMGATTGAAVTPLLAGIRKGNKARMVALTITFFKISGVLIVIWFIKPFASVIEDISPVTSAGPDEMAMLAEVMPRQIANAFTVYNVFIALLMLPFSGLLSRAAEWMNSSLKRDVINKVDPENSGDGKNKTEADGKSKVTVDEKSKVKVDGNKKREPGKDHNGKNEFRQKKVIKVKSHLDNSMLKIPVLALGLARHEAVRMGEYVREMVDIVLPVFLEKETDLPEKIERIEKTVSFLNERTRLYLLKICRAGISRAGVNECFRILYSVEEMGRIAGLVTATVHQNDDCRVAKGYSFSEEERQELFYYHEKTCKLINSAIEVIKDKGSEKALKTEQEYMEYGDVNFDNEKRLYKRLKQVDHDKDTISEPCIELVSLLRNISSHAAGISRFLIFAPAKKSGIPGYRG